MKLAIVQAVNTLDPRAVYRLRAKKGRPDMQLDDHFASSYSQM